MQEHGKRRESKRSAASKTSLRRVAVEAQTSRDGHEPKGTAGLGSRADTKVNLPANWTFAEADCYS